MSSRALVASVLLLSACLVLSVVTLAMLSAESDQSMMQERLKTFVDEMRESAPAGPCEETVPKTEVAEAPAEAGSISQC
jgi:hypothetical protein